MNRQPYTFCEQSLNKQSENVPRLVLGAEDIWNEKQQQNVTLQ